MRITFAVLLWVFLGAVYASDHAGSLPTPSDSPSPGAQERPQITRQQALVDGLSSAGLSPRALNEIARRFQTIGHLTPETFAKMLDAMQPGLLNDAQKARLIELFSIELGEVTSPTQGKELAAAAKRAASRQATTQVPARFTQQQQAKSGDGAQPKTGKTGDGAPQGAGFFPPINNNLLGAAAVEQVQGMLRSQLGEIQSKVEKLLDDKQGSKGRGAKDQAGEALARADILHLLMSGLDKGESRIGAPPQPPAHADPQAKNEDFHQEKDETSKYPERDGLRPPPREGSQANQRGGAQLQSQGQGNGNGNGDKKDQQANDKNAQGQASGGSSGKSSSDNLSDLKPTKKEKKDPAPLTKLVDKQSAAGGDPPVAPPPVFGANGGTSPLPLIPPAWRGGGEGAPGFGGFSGGFGGGGGGFGGGGMGMPPSALGGDPFSGVGRDFGMEGPGGPSQNLQLRAVGYASASGSDGVADLANDLGPGDDATSPSRNPPLKDQIIELKSSDNERHWIFDQQGVLLRHTVCEGIDADKVAVCQTLASRAKLRKLRGEPPSGVTPVLGAIGK